MFSGYELWWWPCFSHPPLQTGHTAQTRCTDASVCLCLEEWRSILGVDSKDSVETDSCSAKPTCRGKVKSTAWLRDNYIHNQHQYLDNSV